MDSPPPPPNRDERPRPPAAASDRDPRAGDAEAGSTERPQVRRIRIPARGSGLRLVARSAGAGVAGAMIGIALALLLPARQPAPTPADALPRTDAPPPAPATRDEALARRRTLETADGADARPDTRPDDHALTRRDPDRPPARAAQATEESAPAQPPAASADGDGTAASR